MAFILNNNEWNQSEDLKILEYFKYLFETSDEDPGFYLPNRSHDPILKRWENLRLLEIDIHEWANWTKNRKFKVYELVYNIRYDFVSFGERLNVTPEKAKQMYKRLIRQTYEELEEKSKFLNLNRKGGDEYDIQNVDSYIDNQTSLKEFFKNHRNTNSFK